MISHSLIPVQWLKNTLWLCLLQLTVIVQLLLLQ